MPELPEVEVICRGVRPHLLQRTVTAICTSDKRLRMTVPVGRLQTELIGRTITAVSRRAKYLLIHFDHGTVLVLHLGMTGNLGIFSPSSAIRKHDHVRWTLDNGTELRFNDSRRFGSVQMAEAADSASLEKTLFCSCGPEPFSEDFSPDYLLTMARGREVAVKVFIMTGQVVVGVGNIYASESLFRAGIDPRRKAASLTREEWCRLVTAIREILQHAIDCGGSTISDFIDARQEKGYFQVNFKVYGRAGERCPACRGTIEKIRLGGRASYLCGTCQQ